MIGTFYGNGDEALYIGTKYYIIKSEGIPTTVLLLRYVTKQYFAWFLKLTVKILQYTGLLKIKRATFTVSLYYRGKTLN